MRGCAAHQAVLVAITGVTSARRRLRLDRHRHAGGLSRRPRAVSEALGATPGAVHLEDGTQISECLPENQAAGDLATVGGAMVTVATRLNAEARAEPGGASNVQLGYLVGAAQRGADSTQGIHAELLRRLAFAARYSPDNRPLPPAFMRSYQRGFDAGHAGG